MSDSTEIILHPGRERAPARRRRADDHVGPPPAIVTDAGGGAEFAWDEFFKGELANAHTRKNYAHAVRHFLNWCDRPDRQVPLGPDHPWSRRRLPDGSHAGDPDQEAPPGGASGSSSTCWSSDT